MPVTMANMPGKLAKYYNDIQNGFDGVKAVAGNFKPERIIDRDGVPYKVIYRLAPVGDQQTDGWYQPLTMVCVNGDIPETVKGALKEVPPAPPSDEPPSEDGNDG